MPIWFRGRAIIDATLDVLQRNVMNASSLISDARHVIETGCSAGGLATYLHADSWRAELPASATLVSVPDSGFFLNYNSSSASGYGRDMRWVVEAMNASLPAACVAACGEHAHPLARNPDR